MFSHEDIIALRAGTAIARPVKHQVQRQLNNQTNQDGRLLQILDNISKTSERTRLNSKLNLSNSPLDFLFFSGELVFFHDDSIYTLGEQEDNTKNGVIYKNYLFSLNESESIREIEGLFIENNSTLVFEFYQRAVSELESRHVATKKAAISALTKTELNRLGQFITQDVFQLYHSRNLKEETKTGEAQIKGMPIKEASDFKLPINGNSYFSAFLEEYNIPIRAATIIGIFGNLYFQRNSNIINLNRFSELMPLGSQDEISRQYAKFVGCQIESAVAESLEEYLGTIAHNTRITEKILAENEQVSQKEEGDIGFKRISDNCYKVYRKFPGFIIKKDGRYYPFDDATLATEIKIDKGKIKIDFPGFIEEGYKHPLAPTSAHAKGPTYLCHGSLNWRDFGRYPLTDQWQKLDSSSKKILAENVLTVLDGLERILTTGASPKGIVPYRSLKPDHFETISTEEAEARASKGTEMYDYDSLSSECYNGKY